MNSQRFKEVKGRSGSVLYGQEVADPARLGRGHAAHLTVQHSLDVAAFTPQQRRDVPGNTHSQALALAALPRARGTSQLDSQLDSVIQSVTAIAQDSYLYNYRSLKMLLAQQPNILANIVTAQ